MGKIGILSRLMYLAEEAADQYDAEVVDVAYTGQTRNAVVRVFVDRIGGISLDECAHISRALADLLDMEDLIPHRYRLEVSSPGVERPLKKPRDFERFAGELVKIHTAQPIENQTIHVGHLHHFEKQRVYLALSEEHIRVIPFEHITKANLKFESPFGDSPSKPSKS
ncbi:MAG: ribosome maturation factor RimP [Gemmatimonadetes bacterium]|nr:MAG: ribosome maturation factor RimP [Gemmatimonadota bacterium]